MEPTQTPVSAPILKKSKKGLIITLLVIIVVTIGVVWFVKNKGGSEEVLSATALSSSAYTTASSTFSIRFPDGWKINDAGQFGALVFSVSTTTEGSGDVKFNSNINVTAEKVGLITLKDYADATLEALPQFLNNYKTTQDKEFDLNGVEARLIGGTFTQGKLNLQNIQMVTIKDGVAYVITATSLESTWKKYKDLLEASVMTFDLK